MFFCGLIAGSTSSSYSPSMLGASLCIWVSSLLQPREMHSRFKNTPEGTKLASTPTFLLKVSNKEGTDFPRCTKKRCKVAKGKRGGIQYLSLSIAWWKCSSQCGLITPKQGSVFMLANSTHTFRNRIRDKPLERVSVFWWSFPISTYRGCHARSDTFTEDLNCIT